jgi:hypothetical protein
MIHYIAEKMVLFGAFLPSPSNMQFQFFYGDE